MRTHVVSLVVVTVTAVCLAPVAAQTRSRRDTTTAYGARLNARGLPADTNSTRLRSRIDNRVEGRLSLRIERYRSPASDPVAEFSRPRDDRSRATAVIAPAPADEPQ